VTRALELIGPAEVPGAHRSGRGRWSLGFIALDVIESAVGKVRAVHPLM